MNIKDALQGIRDGFWKTTIDNAAKEIKEKIEAYLKENCYAPNIIRFRILASEEESNSFALSMYLFYIGDDGKEYEDYTNLNDDGNFVEVSCMKLDALVLFTEFLRNRLIQEGFSVLYYKKDFDYKPKNNVISETVLQL